jgi:hypothetical protein
MIDWPEHPARIGTPVAVAYRSDKWHRGAPTDYEHELGPHVELLGKGEGPPRDVELPQAACALLGDCIELRYRRPGSPDVEVLELDGGPGLGDSPFLLWYEPADAGGGRPLLIVAVKPALILRGGALRLTERGLEG